MSETERRDSEWGLPSANAWPGTSGQTSASPAPAAPEADLKSSSRGTVLIVEDDRAARVAISRILKKQGFAVSEAGTVAGAMESIEQRRPDWILLDLMLPDGCGIDVLRRVRAQHLATKVCVITGCAWDLFNEARNAGAEHTF